MKHFRNGKAVYFLFYIFFYITLPGNLTDFGNSNNLISAGT